MNKQFAYFNVYLEIRLAGHDRVRILNRFFVRILNILCYKSVIKYNLSYRTYGDLNILYRDKNEKLRDKITTEILIYKLSGGVDR